jgi:hypothetical protein
MHPISQLLVRLDIHLLTADGVSWAAKKTLNTSNLEREMFVQSHARTTVSEWYSDEGGLEVMNDEESRLVFGKPVVLRRATPLSTENGID